MNFNSDMFKMKKNIMGESLLETIIAFIVLAMGVTIAGMIMGASLRNMQNAKNRVIAVNMAREGIEAVRNIRDTNWLKFHSKRRACWNHMPTLNPDEACTGNNPIETGKYIIYKQGGYPDADDEPTYRWRLGELTWATLPESPDVIPCNSDGEYYHNTTDGFTYRCNGITQTWENMATVAVVDIDPLVDSDGDVNYDNDADFYNHIYPKDGDHPLGEYVKDTVFTRVITIEYIDNKGAVPASYNENVNRMRVTSTVSWLSGGHRFKVELITHLTDYLGRENLDG